MSLGAAPDLPEDEIEVTPTKALFVDMLTRDIGLNRAVVDLIDNSVDGARRLRPGEDADYTGLEINIEMNAERFAVRDNCGGIGVDLARHYAFRIGRPKGMPATPNSVGQFGVGMKRALFKFGRSFEVRSSTTSDRFVLKVDVDAWEADEKNWRFKFDSVETGISVPVEDTFTEIEVTRLRDGVRSSFALETFRNSLSREIQAAQQQYIDKNLRIVFDGRTLIATPWQLLQGEGIEPSKSEDTIQIEGKEQIFVRIFAGVASSNPSQAGWYVFCNGRMVLGADQSAVTGWAALAESEGVIVPKYHNQFARFRGYVFFDSRDASLLPWNTTKTGVDEDSAIYQHALLKMIDAMRPIINFLNQLAAERDNPPEEQPLSGAVMRAAPLALRAIARSGPFIQPARTVTRGPVMVNIAFKRPRDEADELQDALGARSARDTGERAFDLAYRQFVEEA